LKKTEIEYPCSWTFKIIGQDESLLRKAVMAVLQSREYTINNSNSSSGGKYISLNVEIYVEDEIDRNDIYRGLQSEIAIKFIL